MFCRFIHFGISAGFLIFIFIDREKIVHEYTVYNKYFYTILLLPILLSRDIWPVSMPWLLQIQSHSWDCGHIPEKLIAFSLDICQKWVWQAVGLFYVHLLRTSILFSNIAVPFTLPPTVQLRFRVFCTVLYVCLFWEGQEYIELSLAARQLQLHLLEDKVPGYRSLWHCCPRIFWSHPPRCHRTLWLFSGWAQRSLPSRTTLLTSILRS